MTISKTLPISRLPLAGVVLLWTVGYAAGLHYFFKLNWGTAVTDSAIFNLLTVSAVVLMNTVIGYLPRTGIFQMTLGVAILFAFLSQWLAQQATIQLIIEPDYLAFLNQSMPVRWAIGFIALISIGIALIFYSRWRELAESKARETETQLIARDAELHKLQLQLQPHFLFNSLNSINALILVKPDDARTMVQQLSDFLRLTISRADEPWITLAQELAYLETYLSIEKVRFGHRLEIQVHVSEEIKSVVIPTLILQPLLENAIKFGLYGTTGKITIQLLAKQHGSDMLIEISNPYDADMQPASGSGFGLSGLQRRLYLLYARNDLLTTNRTAQTFTVNLIIPPRT
ncbi:MAG: histidine kinase [Cyclobacteriaceae bacterium]|nr:histidine kinase [Cyclobacteriaceae bacterium]